MDNFWANFAIELALFTVLGILYYFYQKKKLLHYETNKESLVMSFVIESCLSEREEFPSSDLDILIEALDDFLQNKVALPPIGLMKRYAESTQCSPELKAVIIEGLKEIEQA